jgi:membrane peptidoglycan carboxypeptidase
VTRKLKEIALAVEIERTYSKNQILELYFNQIYFGKAPTASNRRPRRSSTSRSPS